MPKLPRVTARKTLSALLKAGFYIHHQTGSHVNLRHNAEEHFHVVIPRHNKELAPKTLKSILAQTEITIEQFIELL